MYFGLFVVYPMCANLSSIPILLSWFSCFQIVRVVGVNVGGHFLRRCSPW